MNISILKKFIPKAIYRIYNRFLVVYLRGSRHKCNICGVNLKKYLPLGENNTTAKHLIGASYRLAWCPKCYSTDRERLIFFYLHKESTLLNNEKKIKLLHIAPELNLKNLFTNQSHIEYIPGNLNPKPDEKTIDITNIQYPDNYFDYIICNHVLEHVSNDFLAFQEIYRVLKNNGQAMLQVPFSKMLDSTYEDSAIVNENDREKSYGQKDHVRIYGKDYLSRVQSVGFINNIYDINKCLSAQEIDKFGINPEEKLLIFIKP